jgi:hypothetical protein
MKVKNLIELLSQKNPELECVLFDNDFDSEVFRFISVEQLEEIETDSNDKILVINPLIRK